MGKQRRNFSGYVVSREHGAQPGETNARLVQNDPQEEITRRLRESLSNMHVMSFAQADVSQGGAQTD